MRSSTLLFGNWLAGRPKSVLNQLSTSGLMGFLLSSVTAFAIRRKAASILFCTNCVSSKLELELASWGFKGSRYEPPQSWSIM